MSVLGGGLNVFDPLISGWNAATDIFDGGSGEKAEAAAAAAAQQQELIKWMMQQQQMANNQALGYIDNGYNAAQGYASYGGAGALDTLQQGFSDAQAAQQQYGQQATDAFGQGYQDALGQLGTGLGYQQSGVQLQNMLASGPYNNFTEDPGYQFRLKQGQDALLNRASAAGGRFGGDTMKALADYNQGAASQEFGNYVNRQNSTMNQLAGLAGLGQSAANQAAGYGMDYGQGMAGLYGMQGAQMSDLLTGGAQTMAGQENMNWQAMVDILTGQANASANAVTGGAANLNTTASQMLPTYTAGVPYAGAQDQALMNMLMLGMTAYSDERLKKNIEPAGEQVQEFLDELEPVSFDYRDEKHGKGRHTGVMAQAVERSAMGRGLVVEAPDGKALDTRKVLSAVLASLAQINDRLTKLERAHG